ncbi:hypothetical protein HOG98_06210 [bacterium]|nr:hypothetical protein [bacterium]
MILSVFVLLSVSILCISYWKAIRIGTQSAYVKKKEVQAYFAARSGIEDAISELKQGFSWVSGNVNLSEQWVSSGSNTLYKSTIAPTPLTHFDYPCTYSVTIIGDPSTGTLNFTSIGYVGNPITENSTLTFKKELQGQMILSVSNEIHVIELTEN